ncbi:capsular biosynthesis protein [Rhizobium sp. Leaf384]|uniref:capsular polysaccharide export protein, LipB/KpsS family n=1 Tax=unclassified Rhizobium TaxID=2613769 RepID=UPI0007128CD1|nr:MULTISPECIES: capsular biosynthesis protein [unclassified Rhizobium]KQS75218.1 capsular biosynthesis protein [Rhizobium sp. Leaf384]KQS85543.1 capsular biosynthesis protein [Rhizobium sp. Leaf383]
MPHDHAAENTWNPILYLKRQRSALKPRSYVLGLSPWKAFLRDWLGGETIVQWNRKISPLKFYTLVAPALRIRKGSKVYVWGYKIPAFVEAFCDRHGITLIRVEDGFLRSLALGATKAPPISLCFDRGGMYFDATTPSDLEQILQTYDFAADAPLLERARRGIDSLVASRLSKYNTSRDIDIASVYGPKTRTRILVVGQVEGDASILKGCDRKIDNNDLVRVAAQENPDAQIIYKPHPELLHGTRPYQSDPRDVRHLALILEEDITLADAFETVDRVYTITSLSGFEALIRGIPVTCLGMPFYAGWGATDDRQLCPRRTARRSTTEIFAAAYILYPRYFDPALRTELDFEGALALLAAMREDRRSGTEQGQPVTKPRPFSWLRRGR